MFQKKKVSPVVQVEQTDSLLKFVLYVNNVREAWLQCVIESDSTILIGDIIHNNKKNYNKGYGSAMMQKLVEYAKENSYSLLYGNLSDVDIGHRDRLYHFYEKFGFEITEYPENREGYIGCIEKFL